MRPLMTCAQHRNISRRISVTEARSSAGLLLTWMAWHVPCLCDPVPYAELTELFVEPAYRRAGIGRHLVQRIEAEARAAGAATLVLMTAWRNTDAHAFYHALGYRLYTIMMQRSLED
jgi:GNAT superfamily N-acetyltransferase